MLTQNDLARSKIECEFVFNIRDKKSKKGL